MGKQTLFDKIGNVETFCSISRSNVDYSALRISSWELIFQLHYHPCLTLPSKAFVFPLSAHLSVVVRDKWKWAESGKNRTRFLFYTILIAIFLIYESKLRRILNFNSGTSRSRDDTINLYKVNRISKSTHHERNVLQWWFKGINWSAVHTDKESNI